MPVLLLLFFVRTGVADTSTKEVALRCVTSPDATPFGESNRFFPWGRASTPVLSECPPGDWRLPDLGDGKQAYALVRLGDDEHLLVFDLDESTAATRYYFDHDADRDLTDPSEAFEGTIPNILFDPETAGEILGIVGGSPGSVREVGFGSTFPTIDTRIRVDGESVPYSFGFSWRVRVERSPVPGDDRDEITFTLSIRARCIHEGTFSLSGTQYRFVLCDRNANGRFDDRLAAVDPSDYESFEPFPSDCDRIYVTTEEWIDSRDSLPCGNRIFLEGTLYDLDVDVARSRLTLKPVTEELHPVTLGSSFEHLSLFSGDGRQVILLHRPPDRVQLPAGSFRLHEYRALSRDPKGALWHLAATATNESRFVHVVPGTPATIPCGEPYTPIVHVPASGIRKTKDGDAEAAALHFVVQGTGGEVVRDLARIAGRDSSIPMSARKRTRPLEPSYKIVTEDGEIVAKASFRYG
jgi:hypothetical protein